MRKNKKFALGFKIATLLTCITLVSVGFASWLIVKQPTDQSLTGKVNAFAVDDIGLDVELKDSGSTASIVFGKTDSGNMPYSWLMAQDDVADADLTAEFNLKLEATDIGAIDFSLEVKFEELSGKLAELITAEILTLNVQVYNDQNEVGSLISTSAENSNTITIEKENLIDYFGDANDGGVRTANLTVKVTFDWGKKLNNKNPYEFYNGFKYGTNFNASEEHKGYIYGVTANDGDEIFVQDVAKNVLTAIYELVDATYTLTVKGTATPASAQA